MTPLGSPQCIAVEDFDQEKSDEVNKEGLGNAYLLDDPNGSRSSLPNPEEKKPSLSEYIRAHGRKGVDSSRPEARDGELTKVIPEVRAASRSRAPRASLSTRPRSRSRRPPESPRPGST